MKCLDGGSAGETWLLLSQIGWPVVGTGPPHQVSLNTLMDPRISWLLWEKSSFVGVKKLLGVLVFVVWYICARGDILCLGLPDPAIGKVS
ncbi:hypothetical protein DSO57_1033215 [Entomophthora muscae]|uniref:Uncharacterized protein n=1 Tax=Entomophthora muscae TaxID=34485 RepID=A0ACC2T075_9FUNG|nr:hypothetical protein DSO57_1033215 [Entomophthora muscae]